MMTGPNPMEDKDNTELPKNLRCRTGLSRKKVSPGPGVMIKPTRKRSFAANVYLNSTAKKNPLRIFGVKPENIMNRYRYERSKLNSMTQRNRNAAAAAAAAAQEKRNLNLAEIERLRIAQHQARNTEAAFGAKKRELQKQAGLRTGMFDWAKKTPQPATSSQAQAFNAQQRTTLPPAKKKWYQFWKGGRKGSRKNRKASRKGSRKN